MWLVFRPGLWLELPRRKLLLKRFSSLFELVADFFRNVASFFLTCVGQMKNFPLAIFAFHQMECVYSAMIEFFPKIKCITRPHLRKVSIDLYFFTPDHFIPCFSVS